MNEYSQWTIFGVAVLLLSALSTSMARPSGQNKLLYIMLDGFRYDYLHNHDPSSIPGFTEFLQNGVRAKYMVPVYPTLSASNWQTLVTGLYPESHGILGNIFYDDKEKDLFNLNDDQSTGKMKWYKTEPIWTTATKAHRKTALILWSRCDLPFDGVLPKYCRPYEADFGPGAFRRNLESGLDKLEAGYDFVQIYHQQPDVVGHAAGPDSEQREQVVKEIDDGLVYMMRRLERSGIADQVNIVIVSDHGMTSVAPGDAQRIKMDDYILPDCTEFIVEARVFSTVKVKDGCLDEVYTKFKEMPGVDVYRREDIPDRLHLKKSEYIYDLILKPDINTLILPSRSRLQIPEWKPLKAPLIGMHGYDPDEEKMRAIFFASGPDFRMNHEIPAINNVDVYPLLMHLLQVPPQPNNGTWETIKEALIDSNARPITSGSVAMTTGVLFHVLPVIASVLGCAFSRHPFNKWVGH